MAVLEEAGGLVELRVDSTGALWFADVEAQGSEHLRVRLRPGELGTLPTLPGGTAVDCGMDSETGRLRIAANVINQKGAVLWLGLPPAWWKEDRRRSPRCVGGFPVTYTLDDVSTIGACQDIAAGGLRVRAAEPLPVDTSIDLLFRLPGDKSPVRTSAVVLYARPSNDGSESVDMGMKFIRLGIQDGVRIARFCRR
jgi:hypothetical protein